MKAPISDISQLEQRYFDGLTTADEERQLRRYLLQHPEGHDALRAVMGYVAVGRTLHSPVAVPSAAPRRRGVTLARWAAAAAAVVLLVAVGAAYIYNKEYSTVCVAYIDGQKVTDRQAVLQTIDATIAMASPDKTVEDQLTEIFNEEE